MTSKKAKKHFAKKALSLFLSASLLLGLLPAMTLPAQAAAYTMTNFGYASTNMEAQQTQNATKLVMANYSGYYFAMDFATTTNSFLYRYDTSTSKWAKYFYSTYNMTSTTSTPDSGIPCDGTGDMAIVGSNAYIAFGGSGYSGYVSGLTTSSSTGMTYTGISQYCTNSCTDPDLEYSATYGVLIAYRDTSTGIVHLNKMSGTSWTNMTSTAGGAHSPSLKVAGGKLYMAYVDETRDNSLTVYEYNGTTGRFNVYVSEGSVQNPVLSATSDGTLFVAFMDGANNDCTTVMKYDGSEWTTVGDAGFTGELRTTSRTKYNIDFQVYNDRLYTLEWYYSDKYYLSVDVFDGEDWFAGASRGESSMITTTISPLFFYSDVMYLSYIATASYFEVVFKFVDASAPTLTLTSVTRTKEDSADVTLSVADSGYRLYYAVVADGAAAPTVALVGGGVASSELEVTGLTAGAKDLYVVAVDWMNNKSSMFKVDIPADITAPTLTAGAATRVKPSEATVTFTTDEDCEYYYEVVADGATAPTIDTSGDGTECVAGTVTIELTGVEAGAKDIYITAKDSADNVSTQIKVDIPGDTTGPALTLVLAQRQNTPTASVTFSANEDGQYYYQVVADGATAPTISTSGAGTVYTEGEQTISLNSLTKGAYDLYVIAKDTLGNVGTRTKFDVAADTTGPVLTAMGAMRTEATAATVTFKSNEAGKYYYARVADGATAPTIDTSGAGTAVTAGTQTDIALTLPDTAEAWDVYVVVKDASDNVSSPIKMDLTATPTVSKPTASVVAGGVEKGDTVTLAVTTSGASIYYTTDGSDPDETDTLYTGAISITADTTVKAFAKKDGYASSEISSFAYTINTHGVTYHAEDATGGSAPVDSGGVREGRHGDGCGEGDTCPCRLYAHGLVTDGRRRSGV